MKYRLKEPSTCDVIRGDCFEVLSGWEYVGKIPLIIADPPYGGILKEGWDSQSCYTHISAMLDQCLTPGGTAYVWGGIGKRGNRPFFSWLSSLEVLHPTLHIWDVITWSKRRAYGVKDRYLFTREECAMIIKGDRPATFHVPLLEEKRGYAGYNKSYPALSDHKRRTNVWTDITELFSGKIHPAEKPPALAEVMIHTSSNKGDLIVDPFAGSGSTGLAARNVGGRRCLLIEKSDCPMHEV